MFKNTFSPKDVINDLIPNDLKYLFVFESPHKDELIKSIPICGKSGKDAMKILGKENISLGEYVHNNLSSCLLGIINVFNSPLQESAGAKILDDSITYKELEFIRINSNSILRHKKNPRINEIEKEILENFNSRMKKVLQENPDIIIVACGTFAQNYCEKAEAVTSYKSIMHPSYNNWAKDVKSQKEFLEQIKNELNGSYGTT